MKRRSWTRATTQVLATVLLGAALAGAGCAGSSSGPEEDAEVSASRLVQLRIEGMT